MRGMSGLSWLLPVTSIGFFLFTGTAVVLAIVTDLSGWLLAAVALPGIPFVWLGLMLGLIDVQRRPPEQMSEDVRMIWAAVICILNVFAFIPYWMIVVRGNPPIPQDAPFHGAQTPKDTQPASTGDGVTVESRVDS